MKNPLSKFNPENNKTDKLRESRTMKPCKLCKSPYSTELTEMFCGICKNIKENVEVRGMMYVEIEGCKYISEVDYLKVVEEKEVYKENLHRVQNHLQIKVQECEEKDKKLKETKLSDKSKEESNIKMYNELKEKDKKLKEIGKRNMDMGKRIEELEKVVEEYQNEEETWTLKYIYSVDGVVKYYEQNGMIKEDAEELIGMDSDNWNHYSLTKEERPSKDQQIEGLLLRCESNEEFIKELKSKIGLMRTYLTSEEMDIVKKRMGR